MPLSAVITLGVSTVSKYQPDQVVYSCHMLTYFLVKRLILCLVLPCYALFISLRLLLVTSGPVEKPALGSRLCDLPVT